MSDAGNAQEWLNNPAYWVFLRQFLQARTVEEVAVGGTWEKWLGRTAEEVCKGLKECGALVECGAIQRMMVLLPKMEKEALAKLAKKHGIEVKGKGSKSELVRAIEESGEFGIIEELPGGELLVCGDWARRGVEEFWEKKRIPMEDFEGEFGGKKGKEGEEKGESGEETATRQFREKALDKGVDLLIGIAGAAIYEWLKSTGEKLPPVPEPQAAPAPPEETVEVEEEPEKTPEPPSRSGRRLFEPEMVRIPAGYFWMGSDKREDAEAYGDEMPQQRVFLGEYWMGMYPVTKREFRAFLDGGGYGDKRWWSREGWAWRSEQKQLHENHEYSVNKDYHPAIDIFWYEAEAYCAWLTAMSGREYRLPTEAEWEKAARGTDGRIYPWGNAFDPRLCSTWESGIGGTSAVDAHPGGKSPFGLLDAAGNVWEWTASWYQAYPGATDQSEDDGTRYRVLRGGSWGYDPMLARCAARHRALSRLLR